MDLTVIVPTFNEGPNVAELVRRVGAALHGRSFEILFVDDSTDNTPDLIRQAADAADFPVRLIHRDNPTAVVQLHFIRDPGHLHPSSKSLSHGKSLRQTIDVHIARHGDVIRGEKIPLDTRLRWQHVES